MMALSVRHSPYTIPSPRFNSMASPTTCYNPHFGSGAALGAAGGIPGPVATPPSAAASPSASYNNIPSSSMLGLQSSMFSSMSPLATCGTTLQGNINPSMSHLLPSALNSNSSSVDNSGAAMGCLSDTSAPNHSPASCCSADSPTSPPDLSVEDSPSPYKSCSVAGCYSSLSPPSSPGALPGSMLNGSRSPPPPPGSSLPLAGSSSLPGYPCTAAPSPILPSPMYPSQDYSSSFSSFSSSMPTSFSSSSVPSLSMPMWSPYPSLPNIGPLPSPSLPKLSYDSPRYKLTPERAIPLIKWFEEHKEHPYPTRHEKIILCQSTQLTFTQVSTWFANARRRMKKALSEEEESSSQGSGSNSDRENSPDCNSHGSNLRSSN